MKSFLIATAAAALIVTVADAQFKTPAQTQTGPGTIKITAPGATTTSAGGDDQATARRISRDDAMKMVKQKKAVYVDVRSKESFDEGHLPGAISIPLSELPARFKDLPRGKFLITYCA
ncbi:MAG: rhodanese-like domain-containing protein [Acidobacteriota bacterium]|nr:rhodanese-like domain-containing protein [Acidobacteriota bacterium]